MYIGEKYMYVGSIKYLYIEYAFKTSVHSCTEPYKVFPKTPLIISSVLSSNL